MKGKYEAKIVIISWHFSICVTQPDYTFNKILKKTVLLLAYSPLC